MADYNLGRYRIKPCGDYDPTREYKYLDMVSFDGGSFVCINDDTIDGTACIGILPEGDSDSEIYWQCIARRGEIGPAAKSYQEFIVVNDFMWDFSQSDKIIIPDGITGLLAISNAYDGCCGIIVTKNKNFELPANSDFSIDFDYIEAGTNQYYLYSFVCCNLGAGSRFIWNRAVINQ